MKKKKQKPFTKVALGKASDSATACNALTPRYLKELIHIPNLVDYGIYSIMLA